MQKLPLRITVPEPVQQPPERTVITEFRDGKKLTRYKDDEPAATPDVYHPKQNNVRRKIVGSRKAVEIAPGRTLPDLGD